MNPEIVLIAAVAADGGIGHGQDLLFRISADMRRFKELTMGHPIIMGRKTFESFPNGPLPGRKNIVITMAQERTLLLPGRLPRLLKLPGQVWLW